MQTFISEALSDILRQQQTLENVLIVLPSQRAKIFVKNALKQHISLGILPEIVSIEEWIVQISKLHKIESATLLFDFYQVYQETEQSPESFEKFIDWAPTVLNDFNEIDQYLVDSKNIFAYLRDIQRLRKWSVSGTFQETELIKSHLYFLEKLHPLYIRLNDLLMAKKQGYQGLLYRKAVALLPEYLNLKENHSFYFLGFNALNKAEEQLITTSLTHNASEIYWDIDVAFLEKNHQSATFIKQYIAKWDYYKHNSPKIIGNNFNDLEDITVLGVTKEVSQIKVVSEILENTNHAERTALVLGDETVLPIVLNSIPKNIKGINITMGYQLKDLPVTSLFSKILYVKEGVGDQLYYKDVFFILTHPSLSDKNDANTKTMVNSFIADINQSNKTFISYSFLIEKFQKGNSWFLSCIKNIFSRDAEAKTTLRQLTDLIMVLKQQATSIEKESLFRFYTIFNQIISLNHTYKFISNIKTLRYFFDHYISKENLFFQGEPLMGLQIMGMLETRVLDFEHLIITGVNENVLPKSAKSNSFIPYDVKRSFGLPTYQEKDAIFSYHFFRLLSRSKKVHLLYNTISDDFGQGEKSRFLMQLELLKPNYKELIMAPKVNSEPIEARSITRTSAIDTTVKALLEKGLSPTAITAFLYNPLTFYKKYILKIKEADEVEETIAFNTLGNVIHKTLKQLYDPFVGKFVKEADIKQMMNISDAVVESWFGDEVGAATIHQGKNKLIFEVAKNYIQNFLSFEKQQVSDSKNTLKIISLEEDFRAQISLEEVDAPVILRGQIDRIDQFNGVVRIIDYKTGKVEKNNLKIPAFDDLENDKYHKAIQLLVYALLAKESLKGSENRQIIAGNLSFKNLKEGYLWVNFSKAYRGVENTISDEKLEEFKNALKHVITQMLTVEAFVENLDAKY